MIGLYIAEAFAMIAGTALEYGDKMLEWLDETQQQIQYVVSKNYFFSAFPYKLPFFALCFVT